MKKTKIVSYLLSAVIAFGAVNVPGYALSTGWQNATEATGRITTDAITSATDENWYKFTTTVANEFYTVGLKDEPTVNAYGFELRYQQTAGTRPIVLENTTYTTAAGTSYMRGTLENAGTYYVRVFSRTGEYMSDPYTLTISHGLDCSANITRVDTDGQKYDWAACAEMLGKAYYNHIYGVTLTSRNYKNAARFIQSSGSDDTASLATATRTSLANTAIAADYIFSGDYMVNPKFKVTDTLQTPTDFRKYIWKTNREDCILPVIIQLRDNESLESDRLSRYLLLEGVSNTYNELTVIDPDVSGDQYISTLELLLTYDDGIYEYHNEAIICE